jgi:ATP-binding cassette subfamily B protein
MKKQPELQASNPKHLGKLKTFSLIMLHFNTVLPHKAINDISFSVKTGETIAFVGPSGSGKSTLMKLLVGLYRPQSGKILYNGLDETEIHFDDLRNQIGFVTQDTNLFSGTIRENLMFVNPTATESELIDVLNKASCQNLLARTKTDWKP